MQTLAYPNIITFLKKKVKPIGNFYPLYKFTVLYRFLLRFLPYFACAIQLLHLVFGDAAVYSHGLLHYAPFKKAVMYSMSIPSFS